MCWGLNQTRNMFWNLENKICSPEHLCSSTVLHSNSVLTHFTTNLKKKSQLQPFGHRDFDNVSQRRIFQKTCEKETRIRFIKMKWKMCSCKSRWTDPLKTKILCNISADDYPPLPPPFVCVSDAVTANFEAKMKDSAPLWLTRWW